MISTNGDDRVNIVTIYDCRIDDNTHAKTQDRAQPELRDRTMSDIDRHP